MKTKMTMSVYQTSMEEWTCAVITALNDLMDSIGISNQEERKGYSDTYQAGINTGWKWASNYIKTKLSLSKEEQQ
jgi:hypothetical protein